MEVMMPPGAPRLLGVAWQNAGDNVSSIRLSASSHRQRQADVNSDISWHQLYACEVNTGCWHQLYTHKVNPGGWRHLAQCAAACSSRKGGVTTEPKNRGVPQTLH